MASVNLFTFDNLEIEKEILGPNNANIDLISEETNVNYIKLFKIFLKRLKK